MEKVDAVFIGTGQAGPSLAADLVKTGKRVAIAEGYRFGGSCVNYGCRPTKTLIASARAAHFARRGEEFGVNIESFSINWVRVRERILDIIEDSSTSLEGWLRGMDDVDVYPVYAHFEGRDGDDYVVRMGSEGVVKAPQVFINTGTRPRTPQIAGAESVLSLDSEGLLRLDQLPAHLIVLGGSYIGLEMGQAFHRLGSQVTIIETSDCVIQKEDQDIKEEVHRILSDEGINIYAPASLNKVEPAGVGGIRAYIQDGDSNKEHIVEGTHWLNAIGRLPNSDRLHLETVGVQTDERGFIKVDEHLQTTASGVYALGDVNGKGAFTHTSFQDYEIVRDNLLKGRDRKWTDRDTAYALFTDPPLGRVGMSEQQAAASGRNVLIAKKPMARIGRAVEQAETDGFIKILVDADSRQFLGAAALGLHGDEVIQAISYFAATGATVDVMRDTLPIHPTVAEFLPTIIGELKPLKS